MSYKRVSKTSNKKSKQKDTLQTVARKKKSSHYKHWEKEGKTTWVHRPSGQRVEITDKLLDELGYYHVDLFFKNGLDYMNIGSYKRFEDARKAAVSFVRRNDDSKSPYI